MGPSSLRGFAPALCAIGLAIALLAPTGSVAGHAAIPATRATAPSVPAAPAAPPATGASRRPSRGAASGDALVNYSVSTLDLVGNRLVPGNALLANPGAPDAIAYDAIAGTAVTAGTGGTVTQFSLPSAEPQKTVAIGYTLTSLVFLAPWNEFWGSDPSDQLLVVLDARDLGVVGTIPIGPDMGGLAFDPAQGIVAVAGGAPNAITEVAAASRTILRSVPVGAGPGQVAYDPRTDQFFVVNGDPFGSGGDTVSVVDAANGTVVASIPVGVFPGSIVYDPVSSDLFLVNTYAFTIDPANVAVISDRTDTVLQTILVGNDPVAEVADPTAGAVLVLLNGNATDPSPAALEVNTTHDAVVGTIPIGSGAVGGVWAPASAIVVLANGGSQNLTILSAGSLVEIGSVPIGALPFGSAYDPANGMYYVVDRAANAVDVISGATGHVAGSIPLGAQPFGIALDPELGLGIVSLSAANAVAIVSLGSERVVATVAVGLDPLGLAVDPQTHDAYVADATSNAVTEVSLESLAPTATVPVGAAPANVAILAGTGEIAVANVGSNNVSLIDASTNRVVASLPVGLSPFGLAYDPSTQQLFVGNTGIFRAHVGTNVTVLLPRILAEEGSIPVGDEPGGVTYDPVNGLVLVANLASDNVSVVSPAAFRSVASVAVGEEPSFVSIANASGIALVSNTLQGTLAWLTPSEFPVTVEEAGLPGGTAWSIELPNGTVLRSSENRTTFFLANGSTPYRIGSANASYAAPGGTFVVDDAPLVVVVNFSLVRYEVTFVPNGLPWGVNWTVEVAGEAESSAALPLGFPEPNGTYSYRASSPGWIPAPSRGSVTVNGSSIRESIGFRRATYAVTLTASGLPAGTAWRVDVNGTIFGSAGPSIVALEPNGTYAIQIPPLLGFVGEVSADVALVAGAPVEIAVGFAPAWFVTFDRPPGAPLGATWVAYLNASRNSSPDRSGLTFSDWNTSAATNGSELFLEAPNGTYDFAIVVQGVPELRIAGAIAVAGSNQTANPSPAPSSSSTLGLGGLGWIELLTVGAAALGIGVAIGWRARRPPGPVRIPPPE